MFEGDCVELAKGLPDESVDFGIHSPPFCSLYIYSDSENDMGNCATMDEFITHYKFLIRELYRVTSSGRLCAVHCKDLPKYANRDDTAGLIDFPGEIIKAFIECGWSYHSRVTIWKCPVTERERTNNNGLLHKTIKRDSSQVRQGMADYLLVFRKAPADGLMAAKPIVRPVGIADGYRGEVSPLANESHPSPFARKGSALTRALTKQDDATRKKAMELVATFGPNFERDWASLPNDVKESLSIDIWRRYAEPVWWDIDQTDVLNFQMARDEEDERHICVAAGSLVLTSEGYQPIEQVEAGSLVLTHKGRWRKVLAKRCTGIQETVTLKAHGVPGLRVTPDHRVWARKGRRDRPRKTAMRASPEWVEAKDTLSHYVNLPLPPEEETKWTEIEWWIAGLWLADGHWDSCSRPGIHISCGHHKHEALAEKLGSYAGATHDTGTSIQIRIKDCDGRIRDLVSLMGKGASGKAIPREAMCLPASVARHFLDGYLSGDGHFVERYGRTTASSVSRNLLLGLAIVYQRVHGVVCSVYAGRPAGVTTIQGRVVNTKPDWIFTASRKNGSAFIADDGAWKKVRSVKESGLAEVWDIQVEEDESFVAEGCVVHNCPLQIGVIRRAIQLWSSPGDVVLSPFAGVGSELVGALREGRKALGFELKPSYFDFAVKQLRAEDESRRQRRLF